MKFDKLGLKNLTNYRVLKSAVVWEISSMNVLMKIRRTQPVFEKIEILKIIVNKNFQEQVAKHEMKFDVKET